ncbi:MAG TPA: hypothetical protein V6D12_23330 [Candidatus Obscuribacterales bacterium]
MFTQLMQLVMILRNMHIAYSQNWRSPNFNSTKPYSHREIQSKTSNNRRPS